MFFVFRDSYVLWTPTYGQAKAGRPARTYIQQLCEDTGCNPEDLSEAMNDREKWREMVRDIRAGGTTWWWWWWCIYKWTLYVHLPYPYLAMVYNYIEAKIDCAQQNSKCKPHGDRNGTVNYMTSECRKST